MEGEIKFMGENKREKPIRNYYSYFNRRKEPQRNGGYPERPMCPGCGLVPVEKGKRCRDCKEIDKYRRESE